MGKKSGTTYCFGCKDYTDNFKPQEVKMSLEKNQTVLCRSSKSIPLKQKHKNKNHFFFKLKYNAYVL